MHSVYNPGQLVHLLDKNPNYRGFDLEGTVVLYCKSKSRPEFIDLRDSEVVMFLGVETFLDHYQEMLTRILVLYGENIWYIMTPKDPDLSFYIKLARPS